MSTNVKWTRRELLCRGSVLGLVAPVALLAACAQPTPPVSPAAPPQPTWVEKCQPAPTVAPAPVAAERPRLTFGKGGLATVAALLAGQPLKFVQAVFTRPREAAILALPQSGIQKVADLVGKKVAANRSGLGEFLLIAGSRSTTFRATKSTPCIWTRRMRNPLLQLAKSMPGRCGVAAVKVPK